MNAKEMWTKYVHNNIDLADEKVEAWSFGDNADLLAELVLKGKKTATASAYPLYEREQEDLPQVGQYSIILNSKQQAICVIQTTRVYVVAFQDVSADHALKEGEGDCSLAYWRQVHQSFFTQCLKEVGMSFDESMKVVCEEFQVVYR